MSGTFEEDEFGEKGTARLCVRANLVASPRPFAVTSRAFLLFAFAALAPGASAQTAAPRARLSVLADSVSVGERVRVAVVVEHAAGVSAVFPAVPAGTGETAPLLTFGDAEAFSARRLPPQRRGAVWADSVVYEAAVFAVDAARVGPVVVALARGRDTVRVSTGVARVPVRSEVGGDAQAAPAPLGPADPFPGLLPVWLALGAVVALLMGAAVWALRRWRARPGAGAPPPAPFPQAAAALDALAAQAPQAQTLGAREALRVFVARRLGLPALETTTHELDAALAGDARVPPEARAGARRALDLADLVAFAGVTPTPEASREALTAARASVEQIEKTVREAEARRAAETARKAKGGGRKTGGGGRRTEDRGRKTEDGGRRTEDGEPTAVTVAEALPPEAPTDPVPGTPYPEPPSP